MTSSDQGGDMASEPVITTEGFPQPPSTAVHNRPYVADQPDLTPVVTDRSDNDEWPNTTDNYILHVLILGPLLLAVLFAIGVIGTAIWNAVWGLL